MAIFDDILKDSESLFINELALDPEYLPKEIPHRENEQKYIATCIKPLFKNRNGKNLLITGQPGIGKTAAIRHIIQELEEKGLDEQAIPIYVNCWKKDTSYKIVLEICNILNYKFIQNRNTDELLKEITKILNKKTAILIFDEVDKLTDHSILYSLLEDIYKKTILLITNDKKWLSSLDVRIKSRLTLEILEFRPYNLNETKNILQQRVDYAFVQNIFEKEAIDLIAEKTHQLEDIRCGLFLLKEAGVEAENSSSKKITLQHADSAIKKINEFKIKNSSQLKESEREILNIIKQNPNKKIAELYEIYRSQNGTKSYRTFSREIENLAKQGIITTESQKGTRGNATIVKYKKITDF